MPKTSSAASAALRALPARAIVRAIADAAERWSDADFPPRVRATAAIEERLGYTMPVVDYALDRLFGGITADALTAADRRRTRFARGARRFRRNAPAVRRAGRAVPAR